ncbi:hypothetical protein [Halomonas garicola]|uniref:hypothetical protein n=1 Tax=Halomonas garicola TaxID=1690008 RepID=UPI00289F68F0|nr:hypothetical protein [Halomonas garicola]
MIEEAIVHVGMHKTGSSSIQATLHNLASEPGAPAGYLKLNSPNHSGFFMTLLSEKPEEYHAHKLNGRTKQEAKEIQKRFERDLEYALSVFDSRVLIISAEDLSAPGMTENMLGRLKNILSRYCCSVRVVGYVRPPVAYMQSAFQQRLKGGDQYGLDVKKLWPHYRKRFQTLDRVFGKEKVDLVPFLPGSLYQGDVVLDFARRAGVELTEEDLVRTNESISLEACASLFAMRKLQKAAPYGGYTTDNNRLVEAASQLGSEKLVFSQKLVQPVLQAHQADLNWINDRLGQSIEDAPRVAKASIGTEADLLEVAVANGRSLWQLLEDEAIEHNGEPSTPELVNRLGLLTAQNALVYQEQGTADSSEVLGGFREADPVSILEQAAGLFTQSEPEAATAFRRLIGPARAQARKVVAGNLAPTHPSTKGAS